MPLSGIDDFHPDQLAENVPVLKALPTCGAVASPRRFRTRSEECVLDR